MELEQETSTRRSDTMSGSEDLEELKEVVVMKLSLMTVEQLSILCGGLPIVVPDNKKNKKSSLVNLMVKYLMSEAVESSEDGGRRILDGLSYSMGQMRARTAAEEEERTAERSIDADGGRGLGGGADAEFRGGLGDANDGRGLGGAPAEFSRGLDNAFGEFSGGGHGEDGSNGHNVQPPYVNPSGRVTTNSQHENGPQSGAPSFGRNPNYRQENGPQFDAPHFGRYPAMTTTRLDISKLREFKITGGTIGGDDSTQLGYSSLIYQMQEGINAGYKVPQVMAGVVKAMKAGCSMRKYFEGNPGISGVKFLKIIRSHYGVKDSTSLLTELSNSVQGPSEKEMDFVLKLMSLRDNIIAVSREEGCPLNVEKVKDRFFHALSVGLKKDTIRLELLPLLKQRNLEDDDLLAEVSLVVARDNENRTKTKGKNAATNAIGGEEERSSSNTPKQTDKQKERDEVQAQILQKVTDLMSVKTEVGELAKRIDALEKKGQQSGGYNGQWKKFPMKCKMCEAAKAFCTHCTNCGDGGHKRKDCTKNLEALVQQG